VAISRLTAAYPSHELHDRRSEANGRLFALIAALGRNNAMRSGDDEPERRNSVN
jgi:hypothetical protein